MLFFVITVAITEGREFMGDVYVCFVSNYMEV